MIVIKKVLESGGACPYQLEALTEDGRFVYLRYRNGWLKAGVAECDYKFDCSKDSYNIIREQIGDRLDGSADHDLFMEKLKDLMTFPEGFKFEYQYQSVRQEDDPRDYPESSDEALIRLMNPPQDVMSEGVKAIANLDLINMEENLTESKEDILKWSEDNNIKTTEDVEKYIKKSKDVNGQS